MNIIHTITGLATGGAERALYNLLRGGLMGGFDNHVVSLGCEGTMGPQIRATGASVTTLDMRGGRPSLSGLAKIRRVVREFQPNLIQGWMYHGNLAAIIARTLAPNRPPLVWNIRQSLYDLSYEKLMTRQAIRLNRLFSSSPDALLYNSHLSRKHHEAFGFTSVNGKVVSNGIDMQRFCFSTEGRNRVRLELGIPTESKVVGHVARLHPMKDHSNFLRSAASLTHRYPETHFLLSGQGVSLENKTLKRLIPMRARDRFHLLGERSDVPDLMSAMDIFCQSSWSEAFPNVLGEAMATGVPCVATNVGDTEKIVGDTGVVVPSRNTEALIKGVESLLAMSPEKRRTLGVSANVQIGANYTLGAAVDQYTALYEKLMMGGAG